MPNIGIWGFSQTGSNVLSGAISYYTLLFLLEVTSFAPGTPGCCLYPTLTLQVDTQVFVYPNVLCPSLPPVPAVITLPLSVHQKSPSLLSGSHAISPLTFLLFPPSHAILPDTGFWCWHNLDVGPPSWFLLLNRKHREGRSAVCCLSLRGLVQGRAPRRLVKMMPAGLNSYVFPLR